MDKDNDSELPLLGERVSVRELAYQALRDACVRGRFAPGQILGEEQLASMLKVSRTPLREAIQRLHADGLLERADNGRIYVRPATYEEAVSLYAVRSALEQLAVAEAVRKRTPAGLERLHQTLGLMQRAENEPNEDVADSGGSFHTSIRKIAANPINNRLIEYLDVLISRYRHLSTGITKARRHEAVREHEAIFAAIAAGDEEAAMRAMATHMANSQQSVLSALRPD